MTTNSLAVRRELKGVSLGTILIIESRDGTSRSRDSSRSGDLPSSLHAVLAPFHHHIHTLFSLTHSPFLVSHAAKFLSNALLPHHTPSDPLPSRHHPSLCGLRVKSLGVSRAWTAHVSPRFQACCNWPAAGYSFKMSSKEGNSRPCSRGRRTLPDDPFLLEGWDRA